MRTLHYEVFAFLWWFCVKAYQLSHGFLHQVKLSWLSSEITASVSIFAFLEGSKLRITKTGISAAHYLAKMPGPGLPGGKKKGKKGRRRKKKEPRCPIKRKKKGLSLSIYSTKLITFHSLESTDIWWFKQLVSGNFSDKTKMYWCPGSYCCAQFLLRVSRSSRHAPVPEVHLEEEKEGEVKPIASTNYYYYFLHYVSLDSGWSLYLFLYRLILL